LVRHGESTGNVEKRFGGHEPMDLSERGRQQAAAAAVALAGRGLAAIYTSDLPRARQTAEAIATACGAPVREDARLRERTLGVLDGLTFGEAADRFPDVFAAVLERRWWVRPPGGETCDECAARVADAIEAIAGAQGGARVAVVSHAMALHHGLKRLLGLLDVPHQPPRMLFAVATGGWHVLEHVTPGGGAARSHRAAEDLWRVVALNVTAHLGAPPEDVTH
jgi:probable phosphoglycerate mutase